MQLITVFDQFKDTPMYKIVNLNNIKASLIMRDKKDPVLLYREKIETSKGIKWRVWIDWTISEWDFIEGV